MPDELTIKEKLIIARNAGYDFLEMSVDESDEKLARLEWDKSKRTQIVVDCHEARLPIGSICLSGNRKFPIGSSEKEVEEAGVAIITKAIELASDLGIRMIQLAGYDVYYNEVTTPTTKERFLYNLDKVVKIAAREGVMLALETMENDFMNSIEKAMYYVNTIDSPYLQVYPDIGNVYNGTDHPMRDIRTGKGHIAAVHLKESKPGIFRNLLFGEGQVDFVSAVNVFKSLGVTRYNAEFWYNGKSDWEETIIKTQRLLRPIIEA